MRPRPGGIPGPGKCDSCGREMSGNSGVLTERLRTQWLTGPAVSSIHSTKAGTLRTFKETQTR